MRLIALTFNLGLSVVMALLTARYLELPRTEALLVVVVAVLVQIALIIDEMAEAATLSVELHLINLELTKRSIDDGK